MNTPGDLEKVECTFCSRRFDVEKVRPTMRTDCPFCRRSFAPKDCSMLAQEIALAASIAERDALRELTGLFLKPQHYIITSEARHIPESALKGGAYINGAGNRLFPGILPVGSPSAPFVGIYTLHSFPDCFWWVEGAPSDFRHSAFKVQPDQSFNTSSSQGVLSTEELAAALDTGTSINIRGGPFRTRESGHYALDVARESEEYAFDVLFEYHGTIE